MKKIEQEMCQAIGERRDWRKRNTRVKIFCDGQIAAVYLHENLIALYFYTTRTIIVSSAGWRTVTTKSRLNALLEPFGRYIYQRCGQWYWNDGGLFVDEPISSILKNEIDARIELHKQTADRNLFCA